jgi:hypothetical protein
MVRTKQQQKNQQERRKCALSCQQTYWDTEMNRISRDVNKGKLFFASTVADGLDKKGRPLYKHFTYKRVPTIRAARQRVHKLVAKRQVWLDKCVWV